MSAAAQMFTGGLQLFVLAALTHEFSGFHVQAVSSTAWWSLIYLIIAGSIVGFTAHIWLLHWESPTKVGTYAYVNPVVAVAVGYFIGKEPIGPRTVLGTLLILISVVTITTAPKKQDLPVLKRDDSPVGLASESRDHRAGAEQPS
jgi:drug/metabolite transporter (DMT)-like permease